MEPFEYVMVLVSIIVGLALTHILSAFGRAIHRLRGEGPPIRLEATYLFWVGFLFIWLVSFWWWEFKLQDLDLEWTFGPTCSSWAMPSACSHSPSCWSRRTWKASRTATTTS